MSSAICARSGAVLTSAAIAGQLDVRAWFVGRRLMGKKMVVKPDDDSAKFPYGLAISLGAVLAFG